MTAVARASGAIVYHAVGIAGETLRPFLAPRLERRDGPDWAAKPVAEPDDPLWLLRQLAQDSHSLLRDQDTGVVAQARSCSHELIDLRNRAAHFDLDQGPTLALRAVDRARVLLEVLGILDAETHKELAGLEGEAAALRLGTERPGRSLVELRSAYIETILDQTRFLDFRGIAMGSRRPAAAAETIFIPPHLARWDQEPEPSRRRAPDEDAVLWPWSADTIDARLDRLQAAGIEYIATGQSWQEVLTEPRMVVLAGAGAGKTSLLHHIARAVASGSDAMPAGTLPILLRARDLTGRTNQEGSLRTFLLGSHAPAFAEVIRHALDTRAFLLLVDSLDEAGPVQARRAVADLITGFAREHDGGRMIVSSREAGFDSWGLQPGFRRVRLLPFDNAQIEEYVRQWLANAGKPNDCDSVAAVGDELAAAAVLPLAATPLLLALLMLVRDGDGSLPAKRSRLYDLAVRLLAEEWPLRRTPDLDADDIVIALRPVAMESIGAKEVVPEHMLLSALAGIRTGKGMAAADAHRWARRLLRAVEDWTGVIVQGSIREGEPQWAFLHRSIAEHLAGSEMADHWLAGEAFPDTLFANPALNETLIFAIAHLDDDNPEAAAQALQEILDAPDPLERHTLRRARIVLSLLADAVISATDQLRSRVVAAVRGQAANDRSPWRLEATALLARYVAATGEDPWQKPAPDAGEHQELAAFASWAADPFDPDRTRRLVEAAQRLPWGLVSAVTAGQEIMSVAQASESDDAYGLPLLVAPGDREGSVSELMAEHLERAGVARCPMAELGRLVDARPPLWLLDEPADLGLSDFIRLCGTDLPSGVAYHVFDAWDPDDWLHPDEEQLAKLSDLAEIHPTGFLRAFDLVRSNDRADEIDGRAWWPVLLRIAQVHDGALGYRARRAFCSLFGSVDMISTDPPLPDSLLVAWCDEAHLDEFEVERNRKAVFQTDRFDTRRAVDDELATALRGLLEHANPAIRGSAARVLLCAHDGRGDDERRAFLHEKAFGPALLEDLSGQFERQPESLRGLFARLLAIAAATPDGDWLSSVNRVLGRAIEAAATLPGTAVAASLLRRYYFERDPVPVPAPTLGVLVAALEDPRPAAAAVAAALLTLIDRRQPMTERLAAVIVHGTAPGADAAAHALRAVDFINPEAIIDALVPAFGSRDADTLRQCGRAIREHANLTTRTQAEALLAMALDDAPADASLLAFGRGLLGG